MKTVLLCRVSSKEQEETGYSLSAQEKLLSEYSNKNSFTVVKSFLISESASGKSQREIFMQMMGFIKKQDIKIIVCEKVDRLTRNFKDAVMIDEWLEEDAERHIHLVKDSLILHKESRSQEKLNWGIRILFAKNFIDNLSEEVKKGQKEKVLQGWLPTKPPLGYKTVGEVGHKIHVVDKQLYPLIQKMFELYSTGQYSLKELTKQMNILGLRNLTGTKIVKSKMHILLTEQFYIGNNYWNGKYYKGKQELFISKITFDQVQKVLKSKTTPKYSKHMFLMKGLIKCLECSGTITWETQKGIIYGHCNHYKKCSQTKWSKEKQVEQQLLHTFDSLKIISPRIAEWLKKALKESHSDEIEFHTASLNELNKRSSQLKLRMDNLYEDKLDEKITSDFYERKFKLYSDELELVTEQIQSQAKANINYFDLGIKIFDLSQRAKQVYLKSDIDEKRKLLQLLFAELRLNNGVLTYTYTPAFKILNNIITTVSSKPRKIDKTEDGIFEPEELASNKTINPSFYALSPTLLPR